MGRSRQSSRRSPPAILAVLLLCAAMSARAMRAAAGPSHNGTLVTLESLVANADLVIRGRLVDLEDALYPEGQVLTLDVLETLKGLAPPRIKVFSHGLVIDPEHDRGSELLLCLRSGRVAWTNWQTDADLRDRAIIVLDDQRLSKDGDRPAPVSMDLRPLRRRADVLRVAKAASSILFAPDRSTFRSGIYALYEGPWAEPLGSSKELGPQVVQFPAGTAAVAWALDNARSDRPEVRALALEVLGSLNAPGPTQEVLKAFLTDPAYRQSGHGPWAVRDYLIRQRAYDLLTAAGSSIAHPVTEVPLADYHPIRSVKWLTIGLAVGGLVVFVVRRERRRAPRTTAGKTGFGLGFAVAALLTIVIGYAWIRSLYRTGEIVLTTASRHRLASFRGGLEYMFSPRWPEPPRLVAGTFQRSSDADLAWEWDKPTAAPTVTLVVGPSVQMQLVAAQVQLVQRQYALQRLQQLAPYDQAVQLKAQNDAALTQVNVRLLQVQGMRDQILAVNPSVSPTITVPSASVAGLTLATVSRGPASPFVRQRTPSSARYWLGLTHVRGQLTAPDGSARPYTAVRVAYPWLFALPAAVTFLTLSSRLRRRRRIARGLCANCGYDLRASRNRCPECGTPMPQSSIMLVMDSPDAPA